MAGLDGAPHLVSAGLLPERHLSSAGSAPAPAPAAEELAASGGVLLRLGGSRFVVDMADVAEVAALPSATRLPGAPPWLAGVANWRGRVLPLLDVRSLVGAPVTPLASSARLVVIAGGGQGGQSELTAGLVAEAVPGVYDGALDVLAAPPATLPAQAAQVVRGQVADALGPIAVLDVAALLRLRELVDRRRHGS
ncbi:MAG: hypothetical protein QOE19_190 [Actinomycetota bacterium]|nr:hypothetical protein [Actinomycetota bacterium]